MVRNPRSLAVVCLLLLTAGCGDGDDGGSEADRRGVGAACTSAAQCDAFEVPSADAGLVELECLTDFKGGYCGLKGCEASLDCPEGSICVAHTDGMNYCFRRCVDKPECNANRGLDDEANCVASFAWARPQDDDGAKACVPPSGE